MNRRLALASQSRNEYSSYNLPSTEKKKQIVKKNIQIYRSDDEMNLRSP